MAFIKNGKISPLSWILLSILGLIGLSLIGFGAFNILYENYQQQKQQQAQDDKMQALKDELTYMMAESNKKLTTLQQVSEQLDTVSLRNQSIKYLLDNNQKENEKLKQSLAKSKQELFAADGKHSNELPENASQTIIDSHNSLGAYQNKVTELNSEYAELQHKIESIREDLDEAKQALADRALGDPAFKDEVTQQQREIEKNYELVNKLQDQIKNMALNQQAMEEFNMMMNELENSARIHKQSIKRNK